MPKLNLNTLFTAWFCLAVAFFVFLWGFAAAKYGVFPYRMVNKVFLSVQSAAELYEVEVATDLSANAIAAPGLTGGVTGPLEGADPTEHVLVTLYEDGEFIARLMNRSGETVHKWILPYDEAGIAAAADTNAWLSKKNLMIHGAKVYPNGDLLAVVEFRGMLKVNKDSELLWKVREPIHHDVVVADNGDIWTLSREWLERDSIENPLPGAPEFYWNDLVLRLSPEGELLESFPVLDILRRNQYENLVYAGSQDVPRLVDSDPLHLNNLDIISAAQARFFPGVKAGDIMVSLRTIDTIVVFDPQTLAITWSMTGPFMRQHDPQVSNDGKLLVYDNRTAKGQKGVGAKYLTEEQAMGYSRIIEIDPLTRAITWEYQGTADEPFYSSIQGKHEELPNGNVLVVEPEGGRVFEIQKSTGKIVWQFINVIEDGYVGRISQAIPLSEEQLQFLQ